MKISPTFLQKFRKIFLNKYAIVIVIFFGFLTFSGNNSLITRFKRDKKLKSLKKEIKYYKSDIEINKKKMVEMRSSNETLEKYAREQYYLKKDSEDIYIIKEDDVEKK